MRSKDPSKIARQFEKESKEKDRGPRHRKVLLSSYINVNVNNAEYMEKNHAFIIKAGLFSIYSS